MPKYVIEAFIDIVFQLNNKSSSASIKQHNKTRDPSKMGNVPSCLGYDRNCDVVVSRGIQCELNQINNFNSQFKVGHRHSKTFATNYGLKGDSDESSETESVLWRQSRQHNRNTNAYYPAKYTPTLRPYKTNHYMKRQNGMTPLHSQLHETIQKEKPRLMTDKPLISFDHYPEFSDDDEDAEEFWNVDKTSTERLRRPPVKCHPASLSSAQYQQRGALRSPVPSIRSSQQLQQDSSDNDDALDHAVKNSNLDKRENKQNPTNRRSVNQDHWNDNPETNNSTTFHSRTLRRELWSTRQRQIGKSYSSSVNDESRIDARNRQVPKYFGRQAYQFYDRPETSESKFSLRPELDNGILSKSSIGKTTKQEIDEKRRLYKTFAAANTSNNCLLSARGGCGDDKTSEKSLKYDEAHRKLQNPTLGNSNERDMKPFENFVLFCKGSEENKRRRNAKKQTLVEKQPLTLISKSKAPRKTLNRPRSHTQNGRLPSQRKLASTIPVPTSSCRSRSVVRPSSSQAVTNTEQSSVNRKLPVNLDRQHCNTIEDNIHVDWPKPSNQETSPTRETTPTPLMYENLSNETEDKNQLFQNSLQDGNEVPKPDNPMKPKRSDHFNNFEYGYSIQRTSLDNLETESVSPLSQEKIPVFDRIKYRDFGSYPSSQPCLQKNVQKVSKRNSFKKHTSLCRNASVPAVNRCIRRFFLPESAAVESIIADPNDRRIKAICDRLKCDIDIYPKIAHGGFLKNMVLIAAPSEENLRKCARTLDNSLHWCLSSQLSRP